MKNTYTLKDVGCYVDNAKGIYQGEEVQRFAQAHGWKGDAVSNQSEEYEEATQEAIAFLNVHFKVERASWGNNENGDFGLWQHTFHYDELDERAKEKALSKLYDINVTDDWWTSTYEDAGRIGLEITAFDIDRANYIEGKFSRTMPDVAELIKAEHGETCDTYKLAVKFLEDAKRIQDALDQAEANASNDICDIREKSEIEMEELETEFERALKEEYLHTLRKEYEYQTSEECIIETIRANDYEFNEEGEML